ncbi:MAG: hypothetical protein IMZ64_02595 [Bacteroidetes bacterium]|nr:hypothetical protein [Bacteroidota bacterium]
MATSTSKLIIKHVENEEWILDYSKDKIEFTNDIQKAIDFSKAWFKKLLLKGLEKQFNVKLEFKNIVLLGWNSNEMVATNFARGE